MIDIVTNKKHTMIEIVKKINVYVPKAQNYMGGLLCSLQEPSN